MCKAVSSKRTEAETPDLLNNTLDNVELVTADDDFLALVQSVEGVQFWLDPGTENVSRDAGRVDTDGAVVHGSDVTLDVDTSLVGGGLVTTDSNTGRDEVTLVGIGLEADEIRAEHSIENLPST
jgi:hypothetical protein